jgi:hypothetical protein
VPVCRLARGDASSASVATHRSRHYPSDMTDAEWALIEPLLPPPASGHGRGGRPEAHHRRDIVDAIRYLTHNGCVWRALPADFPPWRTVYGFFWRWNARCCWPWWSPPPVCRAAGWGSKFVIMDEPTAALGVQETAKVEELIRTLRDDGMAVLLISHNFDQVMRLSNHVWVMRAGRLVGGRRTADTSGDELVAMITGTLTA